MTGIMKMQATPSSGSPCSAAVEGSNSAPEIDHLAEKYNEAANRAGRGGFQTLEARRDQGSALRQLKRLLPHGQFGKEIASRLKCSVQWAGRLMKLDEQWGVVQEALRWAESNAKLLSREAYSVDRALRLASEYRAEQSGSTPAPRRRRSSTLNIRQQLAEEQEQHALVAAELRDLRQELQTVKIERTAARERAAFLEEQITELRQRLVKLETVAQTDDPQPTEDAEPVSALMPWSAMASGLTEYSNQFRPSPDPAA
jgi:hypothetical protein